MNETVLCIIAAILAVVGMALFFYFEKRRVTKAYLQTFDNIGTIVVDHSDGEAIIFLEIASDDVEKWEDGKEYTVKVEVRDYLPQE